jgi:hypothetical protein
VRDWRKGRKLRINTWQENKTDCELDGAEGFGGRRITEENCGERREGNKEQRLNYERRGKRTRSLLCV